MSEIAVVSDSHGYIEGIRDFLPALGQVDALYHLGDYADDAVPLAGMLNCGFVAVRGNCDPFSDAPKKTTVDWHGHRFLLLHGHTVSGRLSLVYAAKEARADVVLFGHSHVPSIETVDGILLLNPGSLTYPRTAKGPSIARITLTDDALIPALLFLPGR